ncbi:hypothetical protein KVT40_004773 [Elsinoe batatas]|uniref:Uncharacterized protein n=1 Tax=Elsinoe batatas TaxID=2601811 RepID=A0A8K0L1P8_9PEZI|nr:hypothetical protein KVT40_004773 [Elsinoe batatas]
MPCSHAPSRTTTQTLCGICAVLLEPLQKIYICYNAPGNSTLTLSSPITLYLHRQQLDNMFSLSHALVAAEAAQHTIAQGLKSNDHVKTDDEANKARDARLDATKKLNDTINLVGSTLSRLRASATKDQARKNITSMVTSEKPLLKRAIPPRISLAAMPTGANNTAVADLINTMSAAKGTDQKPTMADTVPTLQQMATNIGPIMDNFTSVLQKPYLDQFNASLNTVPVVGLKGQNIMYIGTKLNPNPVLPPVDAWAVFSQLPQGVTVSPTDNVHFFPFNADFYMSIGQKVWFKKHLPAPAAGAPPDPNLAKAIDNWPGLYEDQWQYVGDTALPAADIKSIVPFATFAADHSQIDFHLALLNGDGSLSFLSSTGLQGSGNPWSTLNFQASASVTTAPVFSSMAYWNNRLIAYDDKQTFWDLIPDWKASTYTVDTQSDVPQQLTNLTATEQGPVGVRADGTLMKRILNPPKDPNSSDGSYAWSAWIKQDGVTNLGVASPGVMLDLHLLTSTLKARYVETQQAIMPLMNKMRGYGTTHLYFLKNLSQAAVDYSAATDDAKQQIAITNGKNFVQHAKVWAQIMGTAANNAQGPVTIMTSQLVDVRNQLQTQLTMLQDRLKTLQAQLVVQQDYLNTLQAAFWGSLAALFVGIIIAVVGVVTLQPWVVVGGGALFVAGLTCAVVFGIKMTDASNAVSNTQNQIATTNAAIKELTDVVKDFTSLSDLYGILNMFFGRMTLNASTLADMDDATAAQLGADVLLDTSSIDAASAMTNDMVAALTTYLDTLSKQGIVLPTSPSALSLTAMSTANRSSTMSLGVQKTHLESIFAHHVDEAKNAIVKGDMIDYLSKLKTASAVDAQVTSTQQLASISSGLWYDVPALNNSGSIWSGFAKGLGIQGNAALAMSSEMTSQVSGIEGRLDDVRPVVVQLVEDTLQLAKTAEAWATAYPNVPDAASRPSAQVYQNNAITTCQKAQASAATANNSFNDFNHQAQDLYNSLEMQVKATNDSMQTARNNADNQKNNLSPPVWVYLGGPAAVLLWEQGQKADIDNDLNNKLQGLSQTIAQLKAMEQSGTSFNGNALTWQNMVQTVSKNLFDIYSVLTDVQGQLMEDPNLYRQFITFEWSKLVDDSQNVLTILGAQSPASSLMLMESPTALKSQALSTLSIANLRATPNKSTLVTALSTNANLGPQLSTQIKQCQDAFNQLNVLLTLPYMSDIVGYWNSEKTDKVTLQDVTQNLKREYVNSISMQYDSVQQLYSLAVLQGFRAQNVQQGKLPMNVFINNTVESLKAALNSVKSANATFQQNSAQFNKVVNLIQNNIDTLTTRIAGLDTQIDAANKQLRDKIINEVADVVALAFATGALLISLGVIGPATAAVMSLGAKLAATAAVIAASTKGILDALSIDDLVKLIAGLKSTKDTLQKSVDELKAVQPFFKTVVQGVSAVTGTVGDMALSVQTLSDDVGLWKTVALTQDDVAEIQGSWDDLRDECLEWMDMVHGQGINPVTRSLN